MTRPVLLLALGVLSSSPDAAAQRLEIGGHASAILPVVSEDGPAIVVGGGPRVTINVAPWIAVELLAEALGPVEDAGLFAIYESQVKFPVRKSPDGRRTLSFTVGAAGAASYQRFPKLDACASMDRRSFIRAIDDSAHPYRTRSPLVSLDDTDSAGAPRGCGTCKG
jgi:hypothetical protein